MAYFLKDLTVPTVDPTVAEQLDAPLKLEEVMYAIKTMHNGKASAPDRFQLNKKKIIGRLAPLLLLYCTV